MGEDGGGSLKTVDNILLKRDGGWWGAKTGSGREMLGTGRLEPKHTCQLSNGTSFLGLRETQATLK